MNKALRILILDDDPDDLEFMKSRIEQSLEGSCEIFTAANLEAAVSAVASQVGFDWVLADYKLHGEVGDLIFPLAKQVDRGVRSILISGQELNQLPEHIRQLIEQGAFAFISKKGFAECDIAELFGGAR